MLFGLCFDFDDGGFGRVLLDALDALQAACLRLVAFAGHDDLAVLCLETEAEFAGLVLVDFKLRMLFDFDGLDGLILDFAEAALSDALDAVQAGLFGGVDLADCDDLAVACFQIELDTGFDFFDFKFAHDHIPFCV